MQEPETLLILETSPAPARSFQHTFKSGPGGRLKVDSDLGSIEVRSAAASEVEVEVKVSGPHADDFEVDFAQHLRKSVIRGKYRRSSLHSPCPEVRFIVTVPQRCDVALETSGAAIEVDDLEGKVKVKTSGGNLRLSRIKGSVRAVTSGGSIKLDEMHGDVNLRTSGAPISIGEVHGDVEARTSGASIEVDRVQGHLDVETSGAPIHIHEVAGAVRAATSAADVTAFLSEQPDSGCRLTTSINKVTVYLAEDIGVDLDVRSQGGRILSGFEIESQRRFNDGLVGTINGGGPSLYLRNAGDGSSVKIMPR